MICTTFSSRFMKVFITNMSTKWPVVLLVADSSAALSVHGGVQELHGAAQRPPTQTALKAQSRRVTCSSAVSFFWKIFKMSKMPRSSDASELKGDLSQAFKSSSFLLELTCLFHLIGFVCGASLFNPFHLICFN